MKITMNITIFTKSVPQYNHSLLMLFITFTVSKITVILMNFNLYDFLCCKMWQFIVLIVMVFLGILVCIMISLLCVCMFVVFVFFCVWFIFCLSCCANHVKRYWKYKITDIAQKWWIIFVWCLKHGSEIPYKYHNHQHKIVWILKNKRFALKNQVNLP